RAVKNSVNHPSISQRGLAKKYGVSINTIQRIIQGTYIKVPRQAVQ
ncbi:MAG: hypothetical protein IK121_06700, partial [Lachnospiraceae bacterium]|nr:hypothetical protein [Lachnospiraceae bacterium]